MNSGESIESVKERFGIFFFIKNLIHSCVKGTSMIKKSGYCLLFSLLLIFGVFIAGCSDDSPAVTTPVPTTAALAKYSAGDIIGKTASTTETMLYVITRYDISTDQYTRQPIYKNTNGTWGHFLNNRTEKIERSLVEKAYPVKISHVNIAAVPIITPTVPPTVTTVLSGNSPLISGISPTMGGSGATVSVTITGDNFRSGATVRLLKAGTTVIHATGVSVPDSGSIDCAFILSKAEKGTYNLIVTNPDGQSDTMVGAFTITDPLPTISGLSPVQGAINDVLSLRINGQNFNEGVKVSFTKGSTEIVCTSPVSTDGTKILCNLDLTGADTGDWDVTVLNIDGQLKGTWNQKFHVTNST